MCLTGLWIFSIICGRISICTFGGRAKTSFRFPEYFILDVVASYSHGLFCYNAVKIKILKCYSD